MGSDWAGPWDLKVNSAQERESDWPRVVSLGRSWVNLGWSGWIRGRWGGAGEFARGGKESRRSPARQTDPSGNRVMESVVSGKRPPTQASNPEIHIWIYGGDTVSNTHAGKFITPRHQQINMPE